jgi:hypothetical protein
MLPVGGLHGKHAVQRGIWVQTQHLLWDQGKSRKTLIELTSHKITHHAQTKHRAQRYTNNKGHITHNEYNANIVNKLDNKIM